MSAASILKSAINLSGGDPIALFRHRYHVTRVHAHRPSCVVVAPSARVPKSQGLRGVLHVFLDVAELCLDLAQILLDLAFGFHALVADELARDFLDLAFASLTRPSTWSLLMPMSCSR